MTVCVCDVCMFVYICLYVYEMNDANECSDDFHVIYLSIVSCLMIHLQNILSSHVIIGRQMI